MTEEALWTDLNVIENISEIVKRTVWLWPVGVIRSSERSVN